MAYYERINNFRINLGARKKLGQGSQGTVYPGISLITKDPVAAKRREGVYKEYFDKDEFEKEADLLLNRIPPHENIIRVLDFTKTEYEDKGIPLLDLWLITELCEFGNLKEFAFSRHLSIEQKIELMYQSALAVRHLHGCKPESIAHRDVKPENILLTGNENSPTVKLCDFGSAKSLTHKDGKSMSMRTLAGTRRYQAPEQVETLEGNSKYDKQVDIFSLGITYLALLKARKGTLLSPETINEKGLGEIMWIKHKCHDNLTFSIHKSSDNALVSGVKNIIENMIKFEPSSRLSAAQVVEELSKLRTGHPAPKPAPITIPQPTRPTDLQPVRPAAPQPTHVTDLHPLPVTDLQPLPVTVSPPSPATVPPPAPFADPQPSPSTDPQQSPATEPQQSPSTDPQQSPATDPQQSPSTDPQPSPSTDPQQSPATDPQPSPATDPQPSPATDPQPSPATDPQPSPATDPQPSPFADPQQSPATDPQQSPSTEPQPSPATDPQPSPFADPQQSPATDPQQSPSTEPQQSPATEPQQSPTTDPQPSPATEPPPAPSTDPQQSPTADPQPSPAIVSQPAPATVPPPAPFTDLHLPAKVPQPEHATVPRTMLEAPPALPARVPLKTSKAPPTYLHKASATLPRKTPATLPQKVCATLPRNFFKTPATVPHPAPATLPQLASASENLLPGTKVVALLSFKGKSEDHLSFERHDALTIIESMPNTGWHKATDKTGKIGLIPSRFVQRRGVQVQPMKWLHDKMTRKQAHTLLLGKEVSESMASLETYKCLSERDVGTFLVHSVSDNESLCPGHEYTLCVVAPDKAVEGYPILQKDMELTIDEDKFFENLLQLVEVYEKDANGLCTNLHKPLVNEGDLKLCVHSEDFLREGWNISQTGINILRKCYTGTFTNSYEGTYSDRKVFIRKGKHSYTADDTLIEAAVMTGLSHKNLVQLIGVVLGDEPLIVTEFLSQGRLSDYLRSRGRYVTTSKDQVTFARDICAGMQYLEEKQIVHRKLAAQSVLLSENSTAKVGDFSFAHPFDYNKRVSQLLVKWTAPEVLKDRKCTTKSDVWSFGVLLWEIYSFGREPYPRISKRDTLNHVVNGGRMEAPDGCPDEIYHVMLAAWDITPAKRPTFSDVCRILDALFLDMCIYSDIIKTGWECSRSKTHILDEFYMDELTITYKGEYSGKDVLIRKGKHPYTAEDTRREATTMTGLSHENLVQLIGVVLGDEPFIVTEFLSKGRLYDYLRSQGPGGITNQDQMSFARDVCHGMRYLEQKNIVHLYLHTRSVLLSEDGTAKIGDFFVASAVGPITGIKRWPISSTAPEVLRYSSYSSKSDIWSFGILLWQIYSFGRDLYPGKSMTDIPTYVLDGGRMEAPDGCPDEMYHLMLTTWDMDPAKRPTFSDVCEILDSLKVPKKLHRSDTRKFVKTLFRR